MDEKEPEEVSGMSLVGLAIMVPLSLFIPPFVGWWIGRWVDKHFDLFPVFTLIMLSLGVISGIREFRRLLKKVQSGELR